MLPTRRLKKNRELHTARRAWERYSLDFTKAEQQKAVRKIQLGQSRSIHKLSRSNRYRAHSLTVEGVDICVIYDKVYKHIVTVLPEDKDG